MKKEEKGILIEFFGKTLNLTAEDVAPIFETKGDDEELKSDALSILLKHDATRVSKLKGDIATLEKEKFDKGYKTAEGKILPKLEKDLKEKFGIDSDKQGIELFEEIIAAKTKAPELEEDKVKTHPIFLKAEKEAAKKIKDAEDAWAAKMDAREKEIAKKEILSIVKSKTVEELNKLNPIFGTNDKQKINNQIDFLLIKDIEQFDFLIQDNQTIVMKEGKRLEDAHGKPITFEALVKEKAAQHWDFGDGSGRAGAGASNDDAAAAAAAAGKGKAKYKGQLPKNEDEFNKVFPTVLDAEQRVALVEEFEASQTA